MRTPAPTTVVLMLLLMVTALHGAVPACYEARTYTQAGLGSMAYRLAQPAGGVQTGRRPITHRSFWTGSEFRDRTS